MIFELENLLLHWGSEVLRNGMGGGSYSVLGSLVEWGGPAPRGMPGAVALVSGTGLDGLAARIDSALAVIQRFGREAEEFAEAQRRVVRSSESQMYRLAWVRYASARQMTLDAQAKSIGLSSVRMYYRRLDDLHERLEAELRLSVMGRTESLRGAERCSVALRGAERCREAQR